MDGKITLAHTTSRPTATPSPVTERQITLAHSKSRFTDPPPVHYLRMARLHFLILQQDFMRGFSYSLVNTLTRREGHPTREGALSLVHYNSEKTKSSVP